MTYNDGTNALTVTGTITGNVFEASSGGASGLKAFRFSSSTNRGMYFDGSNVVIANSGTNEGLRIEANGTLNVGGTTTYENLVTSDDDIPNRKFVTDRDVPYDITIPLPGPIGSSPKRVFTFIAARAFSLPSGSFAHRAHCITGPNSGGSPAFVRFSVYHDVGGDGTGVTKLGDIFFTVAGGNNQIETFGTGAVSVAVNDVIYIDYEKVDDGTMADVSITLQGTADII